MTAQTSSTSAASTAPDRITTITVTGCVQRSTTPATSAAREIVATTGAQPDSPFILANARSNVAAAVTPEAVVVASTITAYRLSGDDQEVALNVGRRVEITGTVNERDAAIDGADKGTAGTAALPTLTITLLKEATGTCAR
jgi:hypothetical protein